MSERHCEDPPAGGDEAISMIVIRAKAGIHCLEIASPSERPRDDIK